MDQHFDLCIIGTGSGNSILDERFDDWNVAIVERGTFGGTCLNVGCIPSKMLIYPADLAELGTTGQLVTVDQVRRWCATAGRVTVRPVIDLNLDRCVRGYQPTDLMKEQIALRDRTCVFPHCTRPARPVKGPRIGREFGFDADHVTPYDDGGETDTAKLGTAVPSASPVEDAHRVGLPMHRRG